MEILLVIEKLDNIYQRIGSQFLVENRAVLRKVVRCNGVVFFNHTCKRIII